MSSAREEASVGERVVISSLWNGAWLWVANLIGFLSTIILARLLLPDDFGIVATGMVVVGLFEILISIGTDSYLIRLPKAEREDYDTAWTLRLFLMSGAGLAVFLTAQPIAEIYGEGRLTAVLRILALASLFGAVANIGPTMYRRNLQFGKIALIGLGQRFAGTLTTIILAVILGNYWAMVIGEITFRATEFILSYVVHPYRPRLDVSRIAKQWEFCKWIVVRNVAQFVKGRSDQFIIGKYLGMELFGVWFLAIRFAAIPTVHLVAPMLVPIYSGLAKKQEDDALFAHSVLQVIGATCAIMFPAAILFAALGEQLVVAVLGPKWHAAVPLISPFVVATVALVLAQPPIFALTLLGRVRFIAALDWISAIVIVIVMIIAAQFADLLRLAQIRTVLELLVLISCYVWLCHMSEVSWSGLLANTYRPAAAGFAMALVTIYLVSLQMGPWLTIFLAGAAGGAVYLSVCLALWLLVGAPDSGEALLLRKSWSVLNRTLPWLRK